MYVFSSSALDGVLQHAIIVPLVLVDNVLTVCNPMPDQHFFKKQTNICQKGQKLYILLL